MTLRYRAEQVGSLLRPPQLLQYRAQYGESRLPLEELRSREDEAIEAALQKQQQIGIDILTDGEMRRGSWLTDMAGAGVGIVAPRVEMGWGRPGGGRGARSAASAREH